MWNELISRYGDRYSTATIYIAFCVISLVVSVVLFGIIQSTGIMRFAFSGVIEEAEFGGAFAGFLATLIFLIRSYNKVSKINTITITGNVLFQNGTPVKGATVFVEGVDRQKQTDDTGWFTIEVNRQKEWTIRVVYKTESAEKTIPQSSISETVRLVIKETKTEISWDDLQVEYIEPFTTYGDTIESRRKLGGLLSLLDIEKDGVWSGDLLEGSYRLINSEGNTDVRYYHIGSSIKDWSKQIVSVEVKVIRLPQSSELTGSGLIYRFDNEKKYYYAFILHGNESYSFYRRDDLGYQPIYSGRSNLIKVGEFNKLAIVGKGAIFSLYINEISVRSIEDSSFKMGDTGIIATGIGEYYFDNFTVYK